MAILAVFATALALVACAGSDPLAGSPPAASSNDSLNPPRVGSPDLGEGVVIWESNRSGAWRLWRRHLDGSNLAQLTADEAGRDHCCPHLSPDGRRLAYMSYRPGQRSRGQPIRLGELRLAPPDGGGREVTLDPEARVPSEQRAVVWRSSDELLYIDRDGHTRLLDLRTGSSSRLTARPHDSDGWLMNPTLTHGTTGSPTFSPYDAQSLTLAEQRAFGGCQPYFSHDGTWGFWVAGAGGPLRRIDLATREISTLLEKNDARLPPDRGYLYFPMLSRDGTLLVWAASPDQHDFNRSDYDVFVAEVDPATLELVGPAVRLTTHPSTDRFPEVWRRPLALGRHRGETPWTLRLELPSAEPGAPWELDFGDGGGPERLDPGGVEARHRYRRPGSFEILARPIAADGSAVGKELRGRVLIEPARPPRPVRVELIGERTLVVGFDEPVEADEARAELASGGGITRLSTGAGGRTLILELARPVREPDTLLLSGITDRATDPNRMEPAALPVVPPTWPSRREGLVFLWETGAAANLIETAGGGPARTLALRPRGAARLDGDLTLQPAGGAFVAEEEASERMIAALRRTNRMTLELTLHPGPAGESRRADLFRLGDDPRTEILALTLEGRTVGLRLRLGQIHVRPLFELPTGDGPVHLAVAYEPGRLRAWLDGQPRVDSREIQGDFFAWKRPRSLWVGSSTGPLLWLGRLEGLALFDRVLSDAEIAENHRRYAEKLEHRPKRPSVLAEATLLARSEIPTLEQIAPYRQGLVVFEYSVDRVLEGARPLTRKVRVAHWAILDGERQPVTGRRTGERATLHLEPFASQPQLEGLFVSDTLTPRDAGAQGELYYEVGP